MTTVAGGCNCLPSNTRTFVTAVLGAALPMGVSLRSFPLYARADRAEAISSLPI
jgi:hypothetical protein